LLRSQIYALHIPLPPAEQSGWKAYPQFRGRTRNRIDLSCHVSVLTRGSCPHPPHRHDEEEILLLLAGEADLVLPERDVAAADRRLRLTPGQFVYYPAGYPHSLESVGAEPANYMMFKWSSRRAGSPGLLEFGDFQITPVEKRKLARNGFHSRLLFEGSTRHLRKLHCHATTLEPGGGYAEHVDAHDVAIVMLAGEGESLGQRFRPHDVVYYAAGEPHGMYNPGTVDAHYVVFEFHGDYRPTFRSRARRGVRRCYDMARRAARLGRRNSAAPGAAVKLPSGASR
jgi:mannose-6-phosphate isomerase-like protein (cupin superfamily)